MPIAEIKMSVRDTQEMGKVPPQNIEAEQSLLGSLLLDKEAVIRIIDLVSPEDFYRDAHKIIYEVIVDLFAKREPIDVLSVTNRLQERNILENIGGRSYLVSLSNAVPTASHVINYANIVQRKATLRRLIQSGGQITELGYDEEGDIDETIDKAQRSLYNVSQKYLRNVFLPMKSLLTEAFDRIDELHRETGKLRGIPTTYGELDNLLAGLQKSDLVILAARPSVGKTSFALDIARHVAIRSKTPVGIFSLEMSKEQLVDRILCAEAGIDLWKLRTGRLSDKGEDNDFERIGQAMGILADAPILIDDAATTNVMEIRARARRLQMDTGLGLLIIDYIQLIEAKSGSDSRVQEVSEITRALKGLARELNIPVLALSQLNRSVEARSPAIPKLADLRESGSIEQDADVVMFIYRKAMDRSLHDVPLEERNVAQIRVEKHRNGPIGVVDLYFNEGSTSFHNLDRTQNTGGPTF